MARTPLNVQDATFLSVETADYPTHIAGLQIFELPEDDPDFVRRLVERLVQAPVAPLWRRVLAPGFMGTTLTAEWIEGGKIDLDFHVRRMALPRPGSMEQLEHLVERLHARQLDRSRPLWECYFVEGLEPRRFAIYAKVHHSLVDGMGGIWLALAALAKDPDAEPTAPWSVDLPSRPRAAAPSLLDRVLSGARVLNDLHMQNLRQSLDWAGRLAGSHARADLPFAAPRAPFNGRVDGHRRFVTRSLPLARVKALAKGTGTTINDVVLALTGSALRRWLDGQDQLPGRSLVATVPVSVAAADGAGNNLSALLADLGTDTASPLERLHRVHESTARGKRIVAGLSRGSAEAWALVMGLAGLAPALVNEGRTLPPLANLVISNVPGPRGKRYYAGAELIGYYPVSILTHGQGLNVTLLSRGESIDFGLTGAQSLIRDLDKLGDALEDALAEYEVAVAEDLTRRNAGFPVLAAPAVAEAGGTADGPKAGVTRVA
ncbi:MAG: wax ester/triacylglycerol synthase family O-acyltransferase [Pseudomonadales bacterium]|jgi:WS/DGAT/MGAT family acyltransferase|nr:wax ester/triacylglycerol synthase family O-acyltransferase [Pseudomonadales bacterium]